MSNFHALLDKRRPSAQELKLVMRIDEEQSSIMFAPYDKLKLFPVLNSVSMPR